MKIKLLRDMNVREIGEDGVKVAKTGTVVNISPADAHEIISMGRAEIVEEEKNKTKEK